MSIQEQKITQEAIAANGVQSQADKLTGTAAQNKKVFDALVTAVVREKFNALLDELTGSGCAAQLGISTITGLPAETVQAALEQIMDTMQNISQGAVPNSSITLAKLAADVLAILNGKQPLTADLPVLSGVSMDDKIPIQDVSDSSAAAISLYTLWDQFQRNTTGNKTGVVRSPGTNKFSVGTVQTSDLGAAVVTGEKLAAGAVQAAHIAKDAVTAQKLAADAVKLTFTNTTVETASFAADETYGDFPYRAAVPLTGAAEAMTPEVVFGVTDAMSGTFAPVAESYAGGVYIYAAELPSAAVTIPTILLWR
jgi:hypothetical protein